MTLPPPGQPRRWPMHRERYSPQDTAQAVIKRLNEARRDEQWLAREGALVAFNGGDKAIMLRVGHYAGRLFALRERAREEYEAKG